MFKKHKHSSNRINTHNAVCMAVADHWMKEGEAKKEGRADWSLYESYKSIM